MFFNLLIFVLSSSNFVTFDSTEFGAVDLYNMETMKEVLPLVDNFALFVVQDDYSTKSISTRSIAASISSFLYPNVIIGLSVGSDIPEIIESVHAQYPYILCFNRGKIITYFEMPFSEECILKQLTSIFLPPKQIVESINELSQFISESGYTIISRVNTYEDSHKYMLSALYDLSLCNIIIAKDKVFEQMEMNNASFALFRGDDLVIVPCNNSFESLLNAMKPNYAYLSEDDFADKESIICAVIYPNMQLDEEFHDTLFELSTKFPQYRWGISDEDTIMYVANAFDYTLEEFPDFGVFNYELGFYYPTKSLFSGLQINSTWGEKVTDFLHQIENGSIKKQYLSEPIPEEQKDPLFTKIVGKTFESFVSDPEKDSIVMFITGEKAQGKSDVLQKIAHELNEKGITSIKFGYINFLSNAGEFFPQIIQTTHIQYYKHNTNESYPMLQTMNENGMKRFLKEVAGLDIEVQDPNPDDLYNERIGIENSISKFNQENARYASEYLDSINAKIAKLENPEQKEL